MRFYGMTVEQVMELSPKQYLWLCEEMDDMNRR